MSDINTITNDEITNNKINIENVFENAMTDDFIKKESEKRYNRKQRRHMIKNLMKTTEVPIENNNGDIIGHTNQYDAQRSKERQSTSNWISRVTKAQTAGAEIHRINTENANRIKQESIERGLNNYKQQLIDEYGEIEGTSRFNNHVDKLIRKKKKNNKK